MINEKTYFQPSINIRHDFGRVFLYDRYLPTPSHVDSTLGVLKGVLEQGNHAHIIVGPYGSGKSLLGTIIAGILSNDLNTRDFQSLSKKFQTVNDQIHELLQTLKKKKSRYIPVILNGNDSNFKRLLLTALYTTLRKYKLNFTQSIIVDDILKIVDTWEKKYRPTYDEFLRFLEAQTWTIDTWRKDIENVNVTAIDWFKKMYPLLTSGAQLTLSFDKDLISQLDYITKELKKQNLGLFIIHDEFGRFLQTLPSAAIHETMQDLQDLAEFSNSGDENGLHVLLITHRNLGQYALRYNEDMQKEFQRIEKRYNTYYTKSDPATFIRLASSVTQEYREDIEVPTDEILQELRYFNIFPDLNSFEIDSLVIKESYPIHPVVLFVLPPLANIIAQNERTLFTFLESDDRGGLKAYYEQFRTWYRIDAVFDYFEPSFSEFELDSLIGHAYILFQRLRKRLTDPLTYEDELKVIKLLTIWDMASLFSQQDPNDDLISFALSWDNTYTKRILEKLQDKKAVRYNYTLDHWELFEGSSIDIEVEINNRLQSNPQNKRSRMELLQSVLPYKYVLPRQYNDEKSMTRFAPIIPVFYSEFFEQSTWQDIRRETDAVIYYVFNDSRLDELALLKEVTERSRNDVKSLYVFANEDILIDSYLEQLAMLHLMQEDTFFTKQDVFLPDELNTLITQLNYRMNEIIKPITQFHNCTWVYNGETPILKSSTELSGFLSINVMNNVYYHTPEIRNEAFNRRVVTKIQKNAAINVLNLILQYRQTNNDTIKGFGPEYLIYATVIRNNGINLEEPNLTDRDNLLQLREELLAILRRGEGQVSEFIHVLESPPYGLRKPVIPILLVSLLYHEWNYVMLYHNGMFNKKVDADLLYYIVDHPHPEQYTFKYIPFDDKYITLIQKVTTLFAVFVNVEDKHLHPAVFINDVLLRWLHSLPRITQNTHRTTEFSNEVKEIIREGEVQPELSLERLYELCGNGHNLDVLETAKLECEDYNQQHEVIVESKILQATASKNFEELQVWAQGKNVIVKASNSFVKALVTSEASNWIDNLCEGIVGVKRENWSDTTNELFFAQISSNLEVLKSEIVDDSFLEVKIENEILAIPRVDLSEQSLAMLRATKANMLQLQRRIPKAELQLMLLELFKEFTKE